MAGKRGDESRRRVMTDGGWQRILRIMDEAYADYLTGMASLRGCVVADLKRKLSEGKVLDRPDLEQPSAPALPASRARHPRPRCRRPRG